MIGSIIFLITAILITIISMFTIKEKNPYIILSIFGSVASTVGLIVSIWVYYNSESIKEYIETQRKKELLKTNIVSVCIELEAISNLLSKSEYDIKNLDLVKTQILEKLGKIAVFDSILDKKTKSAIKKLTDDELYNENNKAQICFNISIITSNVEVLINE